MNHKQKLCSVEGVPTQWPAGWDFSPFAPCPPGWPMKLDLHGVTLHASFADGQITVQVFDRWNEPTDILNGHALRLQAASGRDIVRMRVNEQQPWSEQIVMIVQDCRLEAGLHFDWQRAELPDAAVLVQTLGVQPSLSVSLRVNRG